MKRTIFTAIVFVMVTAGITFGQGTAKSDDMKHDDMKSDKASKKAVGLVGKVGEDGKTFVTDNDSKTWKVSNPEIFKGHEGHHVRVRAHFDADTDEIHVMKAMTMNYGGPPMGDDPPPSPKK